MRPQYAGRHKPQPQSGMMSSQRTTTAILKYKHSDIDVPIARIQDFNKECLDHSIFVIK